MTEKVNKKMPAIWKKSMVEPLMGCFLSGSTTLLDFLSSGPRIKVCGNNANKPKEKLCPLPRIKEQGSRS